MKTIFGFLKLCFLVLVLALIFHNFTAKWLLTAALRWSLGVPVEVEEAHVDLLATQVLFSGIRLGNPEGFPKGVLADIPKLFIDAEISSLWERRLHLETVEINIRELHILRGVDGRINLLALKVFKFPEERASHGAGSGPRFDFYVRQLVLTLGRGTYKDLSRPASVEKSVGLRVDHAVYRNIESMGDMMQIIVWETLKRMGIAQIGQALDMFTKF